MAEGNKYKTLFALYMGLAFISSIGREDLNVPMSLLGFFFYEYFNEENKKYYVVALMLSFIIDIVWFVVHSGADDHFAGETGGDVSGILIIMGFVCSVINIMVKAGILYNIVADEGEVIFSKAASQRPQLPASASSQEDFNADSDSKENYDDDL